MVANWRGPDQAPARSRGWIEGHDGGNSVVLISQLDELSDDCPMSQVQAVKDSNRDHAGPADVASPSRSTFMTGNLLGGLADAGQDDHGLPGVSAPSQHADEMAGVVEGGDLFALSWFQGRLAGPCAVFSLPRR